ncbi:MULTISPECIES: hypothetical protein [Bacillus]|uniref:Uncharacterized protein n=2 Tax=Bacillus TaxID=1386 RepID=A0A0M3RAT5_9BACI|nr:MULTISPECIES: hypothetical protein [Bacillus]ALC83722.1 hypothetical protein AM592_21005 [Bacillus gobiensis]MBP1083931.1 hypothetical protein [Bacillus capparidis]MED1097020.1 hypothetical protein [Bacillus capparidis]
MKLPIACNFGALHPDQQDRYKDIQNHLNKAVLRIEEFAHGYTFVYPNEDEVIVTLTEWILLERLCCPFLELSLTIRSDHPVTLTLSGSEAAKKVLKEELGL